MMKPGVLKQTTVWLAVLLAVFFALPHLFYDRVERHNDAAKLLAQGRTLTAAQQADLEGWPGWLPSGIVNLGLDLRGGVHLLVEVALADVYGEILDGLWPEVRDTLRAAPGVSSVRRQESPPGELRVRIDSPAAMGAALAAVRALPGYGLAVEDAGDGIVRVTLSEAERLAIDERTVAQSLEKIRRRVDEAGTREPSIQRQGENRIVVQVPGLGSAEELLAIIGKTARLTFHPVVRAGTAGEPVGSDEILLPNVDDGTWLVLDRAAKVTGDDLVDAQPSFDQNGRPAVSFRFDAVGARKFGDYTRDNVGRLFAIVLDDEIISAPVIQSHIPGGSGIITGRFSTEEAARLAVLLRAGALPAGIEVLEQRTVGPELGRDSIEAGTIASFVALGFVGLFMVASYGLFGAFAVVALAVNLVIVFAFMGAIGATLTLPGIAGLVLNIGMAVDANVLIFERIREELRSTRRVAQAIDTGFNRALSAITDGNVTTLIACVIMYWLGSGPVRGFAVTLAIGTIASVFTAIYVTRALIDIWMGARRPTAMTL
jgi:preprotein translocase subunit SecD